MRNNHKNKVVSNPEQEGKEKSLLDQILANVDDRKKGEIYKIIHKTGIEEDDPTFLLLVLMVEAKLSITPVPKQLRDILSSIKNTRDQIETKIQDFTEQAEKSTRETTEAANKAANMFIKMQTDGLIEEEEEEEDNTSPSIWTVCIGAAVTACFTTLITLIFSAQFADYLHSSNNYNVSEAVEIQPSKLMAHQLKIST